MSLVRIGQCWLWFMPVCPVELCTCSPTLTANYIKPRSDCIFVDKANVNAMKHVNCVLRLLHMTTENPKSILSKYNWRKYIKDQGIIPSIILSFVWAESCKNIIRPAKKEIYLVSTEPRVIILPSNNNIFWYSLPTTAPYFSERI